jgi:hypothetical protein
MTLKQMARNEKVAASLARKMAPQRFTAMSGKMAAIVGCILGEPFTDPAITSLIVDSSGGVLAATSEDPLYDEFIGHVSNLRRNWTKLLKAADLTTDELALAQRRYRLMVGDPRQG